MSLFITLLCVSCVLVGIAIGVTAIALLFTKDLDEWEERRNERTH